jgi:ubiquinone/menaquinone biosynthesis C-methylase UbiE
MTLLRDPKRNESRYLHAFADFRDKRVLEVGCGEGRMTWQYAGATQTTIGIDPDRDALRVARVDMPRAVHDRGHFACAASEYLPFAKDTFDIAVLAWSF